jgi:hypothetical protein
MTIILEEGGAGIKKEFSYRLRGIINSWNPTIRTGKKA